MVQTHLSQCGLCFLRECCSNVWPSVSFHSNGVKLQLDLPEFKVSGNISNATLAVNGFNVDFEVLRENRSAQMNLPTANLLRVNILVSDIQPSDVMRLHKEH